MNFKEKLMLEITALQSDTFTDKLLLKKMNIYTPFEKKAITQALNELVADGELINVSKGKYMLTSSAGIIKGKLQGNRRGFAFLLRDDGDDLFIPHRALNGAMHGDTVFAKIVKGTVDEGEVISVYSRGITTLIGTFECENTSSGFVIPDDDSYFCDIYVPFSKRNGAKNNDKVTVKIVDYKSGKNPEGEITEILGKSNTVKGDTLAIIRSHGFFENFPDDVIEEAQRVSKPIEKHELNHRQDFRDLLTITIDGEDARDFDDAISIEKLDNGYKLYVHIADVSYYVKAGSLLDKEALKRATSVYLPNMVLPMLPEALSNGVCSLSENEDRLVLTAVMNVNKQGVVTEYQLVEGILRSNHRMTYTNVTKILNGDKEMCDKYSDIVQMLETMAELAKILNEKRHARGSINFVSRESKIILNADGSVKNIERYPYEQSNNIIEEFMLLANETVAEFMYHTELPFVYRTHEVPSTEKLEIFKQFVSAFGYKFNIHQKVYPMQFQELLDEIKGKNEEGVISKVMLRSMKKAKYTTENTGHFGLAAEYYCHFTSPIRRYPDLMIHRVIKSMLNGKITNANISKFETACDTAATISSEREIASEQAERDADDYFKMLFMLDKVGLVYDGYISGVTGFGIFVELANTVEGLISLEDLPRDKYEFLDKQYILKGKNHAYTLGEKITVQVASVNREARCINFVLYENK